MSASCARLFAAEGMKVAIAARNPEKSALAALAADHGVSCYGCDASDPTSVAELFDAVTADLGAPTLVSRHDIAAIWVAFFSRWQRYRC